MAAAKVTPLERQSSASLDLQPTEEIRLTLPGVTLFLLDHRVGAGSLFVTTT